MAGKGMTDAAQAHARSHIERMVKTMMDGEAISKSITGMVGIDPQAPSRSWSASNKLIMVLHGTADARTYAAWQKVDRQVRKGEKAFHIMAPMTRKITDEKTGEEKLIVRGFRLQPEFAFEQTEGEPLPYTKAAGLDPDKLPLIDIARELGVEVGFAGTHENGIAGAYFPTREFIRLTATDQHVWMHELAHAIDKHLVGDAFSIGTREEYARAEAVAEISAVWLTSHYGTDPPDMEAAKSYLLGYSNKSEEEGLKLVSSALDRVVGVAEFVESRARGVELGTEAQNSQTARADKTDAVAERPVERMDPTPAMTSLQAFVKHRGQERLDLVRKNPKDNAREAFEITADLERYVRSAVTERLCTKNEGACADEPQMRAEARKLMQEHPEMERFRSEVVSYARKYTESLNQAENLHSNKTVLAVSRKQTERVNER